jgi:acyl carrier protein
LHMKIANLISQVKGDATLAATLTGSTRLVDDVGLDSLQLINLVLLIETEFDVEIDFESFHVQHLSSLDRFTEYVAGLKTT